MTSLINKARKPKFDVHLKIYDLNNVPLVSGVSQIKWYLPHSIHGEHRGRTAKCAITNHRVEYDYGKVIPVRIAIDRNNSLVETLVEFEILQEFSANGLVGPNLKDEKIVLGKITLNLAEYVEESEAILRDAGRHGRKRSSMDTGPRSTHAGNEGVSPTASLAPEDLYTASEVEDGVVRRYLMQDSKVNSTLKIGILMVQVDGDRNYVAPPLKTAPVFGGIAGIMASETAEQDDGAGQTAAFSKSRDAAELQDMYRRALAASWACQPGELPADMCIEDIFAGGDGWRRSPGSSPGRTSGRGRSYRSPQRGLSGGGSSQSDSNSNSDRFDYDYDEDVSSSFPEIGSRDTLRPRDLKQMRAARHQSHARQRSANSERTAPGSWKQGFYLQVQKQQQQQLNHPPLQQQQQQQQQNQTQQQDGRPGGERSASGEDGGFWRTSERPTSSHSRSESGRSLGTTTTTGSGDRVRDGFKRANVVDEHDMREDLVAWRLPGAVS